MRCGVRASVGAAMLRTCACVSRAPTRSQTCHAANDTSATCGGRWWVVPSSCRRCAVVVSTTPAAATIGAVPAAKDGRITDRAALRVAPPQRQMLLCDTCYRRAAVHRPARQIAAPPPPPPNGGPRAARGRSRLTRACEPAGSKCVTHTAGCHTHPPSHPGAHPILGVVGLVVTPPRSRASVCEHAAACGTVRAR